MTNFNEESLERALRARVRCDYEQRNAPPSLHIEALAAKYGMAESEIIRRLAAITPAKR